MKLRNTHTITYESDVAIVIRQVDLKYSQSIDGPKTVGSGTLETHEKVAGGTMESMLLNMLLSINSEATEVAAQLRG